jgi:hypothetical protein
MTLYHDPEMIDFFKEKLDEREVRALADQALDSELLLAETTAMRKILNAYWRLDQIYYDTDVDQFQGVDEHFDTWKAMYSAVKLLIQPYVGDPAFHEEWKV